MSFAGVRSTRSTILELSLVSSVVRFSLSPSACVPGRIILGSVKALAWKTWKHVSCGEQHFMSQRVTSFISFSVIPSCFLVMKTLPAQDHPIHLTSTCVRLCTFPFLFPLAGLYSWITGGHCPLIDSFRI